MQHLDSNYGRRLKQLFWRSAKACYELGFYFATKGFMFWVFDGGEQVSKPYPPDLLCANWKAKPNLYYLFEVKVTEQAFYEIPKKEIQRLFIYPSQNQTVIQHSEIANASYICQMFVAVKFLVPRKPTWVIKTIQKEQKDDQIIVSILNKSDVNVKTNSRLFEQYYNHVQTLENLQSKIDAVQYGFYKTQDGIPIQHKIPKLKFTSRKHRILSDRYEATCERMNRLVSQYLEWLER